MNQDFKEILREFIKKAKAVENALKNQFDFKESPYQLAGKAFKKKGETITVDGQDVEVWYHGSGCTFNFSEGIELNYSIAPISENSIKISPWSLFKFIDSSKRYTSLSQKEILKHYECLEKEGILIRYIEGYDLFAIRESWALSILDNCIDNKTPIDEV